MSGWGAAPLRVRSAAAGWVGCFYRVACPSVAWQGHRCVWKTCQTRPAAGAGQVMRMHDMLRMLYVLVPADHMIGMVFNRYAKAAKLPAAVLDLGRRADQAVREHEGAIVSEMGILGEKIVKAVAEYRDAVAPDRALESWNAEIADRSDLDGLKESVAGSVAEHRRNTEPTQVAADLDLIAEPYRHPSSVQPSDALETLSVSAGQVVRSCVSRIRDWYAQWLVRDMDLILGDHLEKTGVASECRSCVERYRIRRFVPPWLEGMDADVDSGGSLERQLGKVIDACGRRLDEILATARAGTSAKFPGQCDGLDRECYQYPDLHKELMETCAYRTGDGRACIDGEIGQALETQRKNIKCTLEEYRYMMKTAMAAARTDELIEYVRSRTGHIIHLETSGSSMGGIAEYLEEEGVAVEPDGATVRLNAEVDGALREFIGKIEPNGVLSAVAEIDRAVDAFVSRMELSRDVTRLAADIDGMVERRVSGLKEPGPMSWLLQGIADMVADYEPRSGSDPWPLPMHVADAVVKCLAPDRIISPLQLPPEPGGRHRYYAENFDPQDPLPPLVENMLAMVDRFSNAKPPPDLMQFTMDIAGAVAEYSSRQVHQDARP